MLTGFGSYDEFSGDLLDDLTKGVQTVTKTAEQAVSTAKGAVQKVEQVGKQAVAQGQQVVQSGKQIIDQRVPNDWGTPPTPLMPIAPAAPISKHLTVAKGKPWYQMAGRMPVLTVPKQTVSSKTVSRTGATASAPSSTAADMTGKAPVSKSNTMFYVGVGLGALALGGAAFFFLRRPNKGTAGTAVKANKRKRKSKRS